MVADSLVVKPRGTSYALSAERRGVTARKTRSFDEEHFNAKKHNADEKQNHCQNYCFHCCFCQRRCKYKQNNPSFFDVPILFRNLEGQKIVF